MRARLSTASPAVTQRRGKLSTSFWFRPDVLEHALERRGESASRDRTPWTALAGLVDHIRSVDADGAARWTVIVTALLAVVATLRGGPQPLTLALYAGFTALALAALAATRSRRIERGTHVPAGDEAVVVLEDARRDGILATIEQRRVQALTASHDSDSPQTVRDRLRVLKGLVHAGALSHDAMVRERAELLGSDAPPEPESPPADQSFRQSRLGETITVELRADRMIYGRLDWLEGGRTTPVGYARLGEPSLAFHAQAAPAIGVAAIAWLGAAVFVGMARISSSHPADHYVGGAGLTRAISDFGPTLALLVVGIALVERVAMRRYLTPYPGVAILKNWGHNAILEEIEARRIAALRAYAAPDPALTVREQVDVLDWLRREDLLTGAGKRSRSAAIRSSIASWARPRP